MCNKNVNLLIKMFSGPNKIISKSFFFNQNKALCNWSPSVRTLVVTKMFVATHVNRL